MAKIRLTQEGANVIQLSDSAGTSTYEIKDSDGFTIFKVDSKGNVFTRGGIKRI